MVVNSDFRMVDTMVARSESCLVGRTAGKMAATLAAGLVAKMVAEWGVNSVDESARTTESQKDDCWDHLTVGWRDKQQVVRRDY